MLGGNRWCFVNSDAPPPGIPVTGSLAPINLPPAKVRVETGPIGTTDLTGIASQPFQGPPVSSAMPLNWLAHLEEALPDDVLISEPSATLTRGDAGRLADTMAQALIDRGLGARDPVLIATERGVDSAALMLGCWRAGVPAYPAPTVMQDILAAPPRFCFCDTEQQAAILTKALTDTGKRFVEVRAGGDGMRILLRTKITGEVGARMQSVLPDSPILLWPDDRGAPAVLTHRNIAEKQRALLTAFPFLRERTPVVATTAALSDAGAGLEAFLLALAQGGRLIRLDPRSAQRLVHGAIERSGKPGPTLILDRPRGIESLLDRTEEDTALADRCFAELQAGIALGPVTESLVRRWNTAGLKARGERVPLIAGWSVGAASGLITWRLIKGGGNGAIGLPLPGVEVRLTAPTEIAAGSLSLRGSLIGAGRWGSPPGDPERRDADGYWRTGRAGDFLDTNEPGRGLRLIS